MNPNPMTERDLNGKWIDFYALLGVPADADKETLRKTIGTTYAEASANADHRDLQRRHYFQTMVERVLPQCRRVLLDPELRAAYDEQTRLHHEGNPSALDYVTFMAALQGGNLAAVQAASSAATPGEWDALPEKVRDEINLARAVLECVEVGSEFDFIPSRAVTSSSSSETTAATTPVTTTPITTTPVASAPVTQPKPTLPDTTYFANVAPEATGTPQSTLNAPAASSSAASTPAASASVANSAAAPQNVVTPAASVDTSPTESATPTTPAKAKGNGVLTGDGPTIRERYEAAASAAIADTSSLIIDRPKPKAKAQVYKSRLSVGEEEEPRGEPARPTIQGGGRRKSVLTPLATHILTGIVSAMLIMTIFKSTDNAATAGDRLPLTVVYASELRPIMEFSEQQFEASPDGAGIDIVLQATDSREGMSRLLASDTQQPDVWIPSEAVWSNRYNQVAASKGRRTIGSSSALALSPLVLVARSDRAATLRAKFPNRIIPSWSALRQQVMTNCSKRFGMTDPQRSGDGALVRYFMARDWSEKNKVPWSSAATNPALWKWMSGFEENVAEYGMSDAMVKDMALGTTSRYWWCLAYESQAINWIGRGKQLEIFYLPGTYFADHPFCHVERPGSSRATGIARNRFEKYLRSEAIQAAMLQSGFRPPEMELDANVENNPFKAKSYADRGVKARGFEIGAKLEYRAINNLTAQWAKRFVS